MTEVTVAFRNIARAPKNELLWNYALFGRGFTRSSSVLPEKLRHSRTIKIYSQKLHSKF